jgi:hypothetical protein
VWGVFTIAQHVLRRRLDSANVVCMEHRIELPIDMARDEHEGMTSIRGMLVSLAASLPVWTIVIVLLVLLLL